MIPSPLSLCTSLMNWGWGGGGGKSIAPLKQTDSLIGPWESCVSLGRVGCYIMAAIRYVASWTIAEIQSRIKTRMYAAKLGLLVKLSGRETLPKLKDFFTRIIFRCIALIMSCSYLTCDLL